MTFRLVASVALLFCTNGLESREIKQRVVLKLGRTETVMTGRIPSPDDVVVYVLEARAGQQMCIYLQPNRRLVSQALLVAPSGKQIGPGTTFHSILDESGVFQIRILPREHTAGTFRLRLSLH
jgi:hypothetical protein